MENLDQRNGVELEGSWEDIQGRGELFAGHRVRVTIIEEPPKPDTIKPTPNYRMLQALKEIEEITKNRKPKKDTKDYLREAREGAMYGYGDE